MVVRQADSPQGKSSDFPSSGLDFPSPRLGFSFRCLGFSFPRFASASGEGGNRRAPAGSMTCVNAVGEDPGVAGHSPSIEGRPFGRPSAHRMRGVARSATALFRQHGRRSQRISLRLCGRAMPQQLKGAPRKSSRFARSPSSVIADAMTPSPARGEGRAAPLKNYSCRDTSAKTA